MNILAFDIGVKNLAYCQVSKIEDRWDIVKWDVIDISGEEKDFNSTSKRLITILDNNFGTPDFDVILIENQPVFQNPIMKSIQIIVHTYFQMLYYKTDTPIDLKLVSAGNKLRVKNVPSNLDELMANVNTKYKKNKLRAIACTEHYLQNRPNWRDHIRNARKKDDLADSFLMAVFHIEQKKLDFGI